MLCGQNVDIPDEIERRYVSVYQSIHLKKKTEYNLKKARFCCFLINAKVIQTVPEQK